MSRITKPCSILLCSAIILLLEAYTIPLSMFCIILLDLGYKVTATTYTAVGKQPDNHTPLDSVDYRTMCHTSIANKSQLISSSTHFSVCSEWLLVRATAIVLTASSDTPDKLDHWIADINNYIPHLKHDVIRNAPYIVR